MYKCSFMVLLCVLLCTFSVLISPMFYNYTHLLDFLLAMLEEHKIFDNCLLRNLMLTQENFSFARGGDR